MPDSSNKGGRKPRVSDEDLLDVFRSTSDPVLSTAEVAEQVPIKRRGVLRRLRNLEEDGQLESKQIGGRNTVWWHADEESDRTAQEPTTHTDPIERSDDTQNAESGTIDGEKDGLAEDVRAYLEENDLPPKTAHGRGVVVDVFRLLRENGTVGTSDLQAKAYPNYTDHWSDKRTMWNAIDRYLEDIPGIEKGGYGEWAYTSDDDVRSALESGTDGGIYDPTEEF